MHTKQANIYSDVKCYIASISFITNVKLTKQLIHCLTS